MFGDGQIKRDFLYVDDCVEAMLLCAVSDAVRVTHLLQEDFSDELDLLVLRALLDRSPGAGPPEDAVEFLRGWTQDGRLQQEVANKAREWIASDGDKALGDWLEHAWQALPAASISAAACLNSVTTQCEGTLPWA